jgi:hypothetical protein
VTTQRAIVSGMMVGAGQHRNAIFNATRLGDPGGERVQPKTLFAQDSIQFRNVYRRLLLTKI